MPPSSPKNAPLLVVRAKNMPKQEGGKQRRVDEAKDQLDDVHGVVPVRRDVGGPDAQEDPDHRDHPAHPHIVGVAAVGRDVGLVEVVGPDRVEGRHVARHARHERGQQRRQRQAQQARRDSIS